MPTAHPILGPWTPEPPEGSLVSYAHGDYTATRDFKSHTRLWHLYWRDEQIGTAPLLRDAKKKAQMHQAAHESDIVEE